MLVAATCNSACSVLAPLNDQHLRQVLTAYISYYHRFCNHLSLCDRSIQERSVRR